MMVSEKELQCHDGLYIPESMGIVNEINYLLVVFWRQAGPAAKNNQYSKKSTHKNSSACEIIRKRRHF
jgi:hypothetical protein